MNLRSKRAPKTKAELTPKVRWQPRYRTQGSARNVAAGQQGIFKEEEFNRDTGTTEDRDRLLSNFQDILRFCTLQTKANCFLIEKDMTSPYIDTINELVDLKFLHRAKFRVTVRDRKGRLYDAYMLDLPRH